MKYITILFLLIGSAAFAQFPTRGEFNALNNQAEKVANKTTLITDSTSKYPSSATVKQLLQIIKNQAISLAKVHTDSLKLDPNTLFSNTTYSGLLDAKFQSKLPLYGKTIAIIGDSFVQQGLVQGYINSVTGATISYTDGVGGSTIAGITSAGNSANTAEGDGVNRVPISDDTRLTPWLNSGANILILFAGLNDPYYQTALGTINSTDDSFAGRLNKILTAYENKVAGLTHPPRLVAFTATVRPGSNKAGTAYTDANIDSLQGKYINLEIAIFQKHHISLNVPYYDLGINLHNYQPYTTTDVVHLNSDEGKLSLGYYCAYRTVSGSPYVYNIGVTTSATTSSNSGNILTGSVFNSPEAPYAPSGVNYGGISAFDGDVTTFFASEENPTTGYVGINFGSVKTITKVSIYPRSSNSTTITRITGALIQGSTDGTTYTNLTTIGTIPGSQFTDFAISGSYKYIRLYRNDGTNLDVGEIQIYGY